MNDKNEKSLLPKKVINNLIVVAYVGIVLGYGLLLYAKLKHSEK